MLITQPGDANIYVNGEHKGNSSKGARQSLNMMLPIGKYIIEAIKASGESEEYYGIKETTVAISGVEKILLKLEKRPTQTVRDRIKAKYPDGVVEPEMISIPDGSFHMGCVSGNGCYNQEKPVHIVNIKALLISKYEVTFEQWDACVAFGGCDQLPEDEDWGRGNQPVINVSWNDVQQYTKWLSKQTGKQYRLLTEAEWEYAARAGSQTEYYWGNESSKNKANCSSDCDDDFDKTAPVGSFEANRFGLHDMAGNVYEWVEDCWNHNYKKAPADGSAWLSGHCSQRVLRGGSWYGGRRGRIRGDIRSAYRSNNVRDYRFFSIGFRVAITR